MTGFALDLLCYNLYLSSVAQLAPIATTTTTTTMGISRIIGRR